MAPPAAAKLSDRAGSKVRKLCGTGGSGEEEAAEGLENESSLGKSPISIAAKVQKNVLGGLKDGSLDKLVKEASAQGAEDTENGAEEHQGGLSGLQWARMQGTEKKPGDDDWARSIAEELKKEPAWASDPNEKLTGLDWAKAQGASQRGPTEDDAQAAREMLASYKGGAGGGGGGGGGGVSAPVPNPGGSLPRAMSALGKTAVVQPVGNFQQIPEGSEGDADDRPGARGGCCMSLKKRGSW